MREREAAAIFIKGSRESNQLRLFGGYWHDGYKARLLCVSSISDVVVKETLNLSVCNVIRDGPARANVSRETAERATPASESSLSAGGGRINGQYIVL